MLCAPPAEVGVLPRRVTGPTHIMQRIIHNVRSSQKGQGITEYVVMLTLILMLVVGTVRLVGVNAKNALSGAGNALQHHSDSD